MKQTTKTENFASDEAAETIHLVTPKSGSRPLCGAPPDCEIGMYCEHILDGEWVRAVYGKHGRQGKACESCLELYPSLLWSRPESPNDNLSLQSVITIKPYPMEFRGNFTVSGRVCSNDFVLDGEPTVVGQRRLHGKTALTILFRILPKPISKPGR